MIKIFITTLLTLSLLHTAYAAVTIPDKYRPANISNELEIGEYNSDTINAYLQLFAGRLIKLAGPLAVLMIIVAALLMATSRGEEQAENGKKRIQYVLYGLLTIIVSYVLVSTIITIVYDVYTKSTSSQTTK